MIVWRKSCPAVYARPPRGRRDHLRLNPRHVPGVGEGYNHIIDMDDWHDDRSDKFNILWERTEEEVVVEWKKGQPEG